MICLLKQLSLHDGGATMIEYCLMLALIAAVGVSGVQLVGQKLLVLFKSVVAAI
jgi:Flp pilus assembly pilin Flp